MTTESTWHPSTDAQGSVTLPPLKTITRTPDRFFGTCCRHQIQIDREKNGAYYIMVWHPTGARVCDGYWYGLADMDAAIQAAIDDSRMLVPDDL